MAAIIEMPRPKTLSPSEVSAPDHIERQPRTPLVLVPGGRSAEGRRRRRMYFRRRLAVLLGALVFAYAAWASFSSPVPAAAVPIEAGVPVAGHVVQRGDTLWTVARGLGAPGDLRDTVSALSDANGGAMLVPGQVIEIPADLRQA
jgi:hypothetical protein